MADLDLTKLERSAALAICQKAFGLSAFEAEAFLSLARGEVTTLKASDKYKRDRFGRFARIAGGYAGALASGFGQGAAGIVGHKVGQAAGKRYGPLGGFAGSLLGTRAAAAASGKLGERTSKLLRTKRQRDRALLLTKIGRAAGFGATTVYYLHKPLRAAFRGARKGLRNRKRYADSLARAALPKGKIIDVNNYRFAERLFSRMTEKAVKQSLDARIAEVREAFRAQYPSDNTTYYYIYETWPDYVIVEGGGKCWKVGYSSDLQFDSPDQWTEVTRKVTWESKELYAQAMVFKEEASDDYRWVLLSSNGFRDRDGQIVSTKSLERDVALWELEGAQPDPLRWWHVPLTEDFKEGVELGYTDFRMVYENTLIESGKFLTKEIGEGVYNARDQLAASVGFRHPADEPDENGVFENVHIFERSLLPKGNASNPLTHLLVTE